MADLFDLPFEDDVDDQQSTVASRQSPVDRRQPEWPPTTDDGRLTTDDRRPSTDCRILTVTELTVRVRDLVENTFPEVWVEGEVSNWRVWSTGHVYFTLKDATSQVRSVFFRTALRYLKFKPADGLRVVARGRLSVYEPKGEYQLICEHMEPQGLGALQLAFDQLKQRLQGEGLFAADRKRALPALPRKIGIVTSLDGAVLRDIIKVLRRRHVNVHLIVRPSRVQGEGAAAEIARGLRAMAHVSGIDVIIVARGGGSIEDLWAFNEEIVARAIAHSPVPVISAVGHETDFTIADFVADLRAPTPSAAAELVVAAKSDFTSRIDRLYERLAGAARTHVDRLSRRIHAIDARPALAGFHGRVAMRGLHTADLTHTAARSIRADLAARVRHLQALQRQLHLFDLGRRLARIRTGLVTADGRLGGAIVLRHHRAHTAFRETAGRLESLSPVAVLARGYAVCWTADGTRIVRTSSEVRPGDMIRVTLSQGAIDAKVSQTE